MIIQKANTDINTEWLTCLLNANDMSLFEHVCFVRPGYAFSNIAAIKSIDEWQDAIKDGDIFPLYDVANVDILNETTSYLQSQLNVQYKGHPGKYIVRIKLHYNYYYYQKIQKISGQDYDLVFVDINKNVYAYSPQGTFVKGLPTELINFEKIKIGGTSAKYTELYIVLDDPAQFVQHGIVEKIDFKFTETISYEVVLINVDYTDEVLTFNVESLQSGTRICGLTSYGLTIVDATNGQITWIGFSELDEGLYVISGMSGELTLGNININECVFYGNNEYDFSEIEGIIIKNGGATGTTDWIDTNTDGLADDWDVNIGVYTPSIITGGGFNGNAQRCIEKALATAYLTSEYTTVDLGKQYAVKIKYRSNYNLYITVDGIPGTVGTGAPNTGAALVYQGSGFTPTETPVRVGFTHLTWNAGEWFEVDEVQLVEL